jgi:hypothetical protein
VAEAPEEGQGNLPAASFVSQFMNQPRQELF